ncbi:MAG: TetR/AcrR family transcriptional regulator [Actinomycetales bacterium]|nr:MAG: TetR/AcrR family transcriptional regulator [Actinomycetales bacterium]
MTAPGAPTRKREATRERILDAARLVLAETGIQGATVETICDRAGFTRGAFYSNFASKEDLVLALFHRESDLLMQEMSQALDAELQAGEDAATVVSRVLDRFLRGYPHDRMGFLINQEFITHGARHREIAQVYRGLWQRTVDDITGFVEKAAEALELRLTMPAESAAYLLLGAFEVSIRTHFLDSDADELDGTLLQRLVGDLLVTVLAGQEQS